MKQAECDILHINLVRYSLKELRGGLRPVKLRNDLWIAYRREITSLGLFAFLHIMNHFKTLLHKIHLKVENRDHLSLKYTSRDF